jgi:hypothetical protein
MALCDGGSGTYLRSAWACGEGCMPARCTCPIRLYLHISSIDTSSGCSLSSFGSSFGMHDGAQLVTHRRVGGAQTRKAIQLPSTPTT